MSAGDTPSPRPRAGPSRGVNRWLVLSVASFGVFNTTFDSGIVPISYPALTEAFNTDPSTILWVSVAFWTTAIGLMMTVGWIGDVAGRRRAFATGFVIVAIGLILASVSQTVWQVIASRVLQGVGTALVLANLTALVGDVFPRGERGRAMGVLGAAVGLGLTTGPLAGGLLLDALDWRALFYVRVPLPLLCAGLALWLLPRDAVRGGSHRLDYVGAVALFGTMASILLVINRGSAVGFGSPVALTMAGLAAVFLPVLVWSQRRSVRPILDFALFKRRLYTFNLGVLITHYIAQGPILLLAPFFFIGAMGFSATRTGVFLAGFTLMRTVVAPASGSLSDRVGFWPLSSLGVLLMGGGLFWLSRLGTGGSEWVVLGSLLLAGLGSALFEPPNSNAILGSVPSERLGTASASIATGRQLSFAVGVALAGAIFTIRERVYRAELSTSALDGGSEIPEAIARAFSDALIAGVVLSAVALVLALASRTSERRSAEGPADPPLG